MSDVYLNNKFIGTVDNGSSFAEQVIGERRNNSLNTNVNVSYNKETDSVLVENDKGRLRKPVIVVKEGKSTLTEKQIQIFNRTTKANPENLLTTEFISREDV